VTDSSAGYDVQQRRIRVRPCAICTSFQCLDVRTSAKARACTGLRSLRSGAPHRLPHSVPADERHAEEVTNVSRTWKDMSPELRNKRRRRETVYRERQLPLPW